MNQSLWKSSRYNTLLSRDEFRAAVFAEDGGLCVVCTAPAVDAHHVYDRALWDDGGYYLANGVSLCERCHLAAEGVGVDQPTDVHSLLSAAGRSLRVTPWSDPSESYDKFGNGMLADGRILPGPMYEGLGHLSPKYLAKFVAHFKYPSTYHLPWSNWHNNEKAKVFDVRRFVGRDVVVTEKMDGENTTVYPDGKIHARSIDSGDHWTRHWAKTHAATWAHEIPPGLRVCGENMYGQHSIAYDDLESYFLGFGVWRGNTCLGWDDTLEYFELLGVAPVPVLYEGAWEDWTPPVEPRGEGYVVRLRDEIPDWSKGAAKYVRPHHVQTDEHWLFGEIPVNGLASATKP